MSTSRLQSFISIGDGALVLPYINYTALKTLSQLSKKMHDICEANKHLTLFYGHTLPSPGWKTDSAAEPTDIFYDLFHKRYNELKAALASNQDIFISHQYWDFNPITNTYEGSMYRATTYNRLWNNMCLMELAYMLQDEDAIALLISYDRYDACKIGSYSTEYGKTSIALLTEYGDYHIKDAILALRPLNRD
jgi:hypothetical protein